MKLLFDENLSPRLVTLLADVYPGSESVLSSGLGGASDDRIWRYASEKALTIVSKDLDFVDRAIAASAERIICLRLGNCTTEAAHLVMRNSIERVEAFGASPDLVLELP